MPEFRNVRPRDAINAFLRAGAIEKGGKGDHVNLKMPNGQIVTLVNDRRAMKIGLLKAMIRKAGLTDDEFIRLLKA